MSGALVLSARNLAVGIAQRLLVRALDLDVRAGALWCVLGPNGSGKSTLLATLAGLRPPQAGAVAFEGRAWKEWKPRDAARRRGLSVQAPSFAFSASVRETVMLGRHPYMGRFGRPLPEDRRSVSAALAAMDLDPLVDRDVLTLSGGERQRVALAVLLAQDPLLLLCDEPTSHLDLKHQVAFFREIARLVNERARAAVVVTHDYNLAARFATHVCLLYGDGRAAAGETDAVMNADALSKLFGFALESQDAPHGRSFRPQW